MLPFGLTLGVIGDRYFTYFDLKKYKNKEIELNKIPFKLNKEDKIRIIFILISTLFSLPWINALIGLSIEGINFAIPLLGIEGLMAHLYPFFPIHLGLHHGWMGYFIIFCSILNSKIEKLFDHSIVSEWIIFGFCFISIWGTGWLLNDFVYEQIAPIFPGAYFPFLTPSRADLYKPEFIIQIFIVMGLAFLMYYFGWRKYYRPKIIKKS